MLHLVKCNQDFRKASKLAFDKRCPVILMLHSPQCKYCREALPAYEAASRKNQEGRIYAAIDTTDHEEMYSLLEELQTKLFDSRGVPSFFVIRRDYTVEKVEPNERTAKGFLDIV
jgi:thiol-disulfide isomerase/thioredoxin